MHIPDGFLNGQLNFNLTAVSLIAGSFTLKKVKESLFAKSQVLVPQLVTNIGQIGQSKLVSRWFFKTNARQKIQKMALVFCLVFTTQIIDFIKIGEIPGHLIGSLLAALVLGLWAGVLVMSAVLAVQAIFLGDGGITVLGVNIFNMAIVGCIGGYYLYLGLKKLVKNNNLAIFFSSWFSVMAMVLVYAIEAKIAGQGEGVGQLIIIHTLVGIVEGLVTILALKYLFAAKAYEK